MSNRIEKINQLFQEELAESVRQKISEEFKGILVSVTAVKSTPDLSLSRVYISVFPTEHQTEIIATLKTDIPFYRNRLAKTVANKMRKVPDLRFFLDNSIEQTEALDKALRGDAENPIL